VRLFLLRYDHRVFFLYLRIDDLCLDDWHHDGLHHGQDTDRRFEDTERRHDDRNVEGRDARNGFDADRRDDNRRDTAAVCIESVTCVSSFYVTIIVSSFCIFESTICVLIVNIITM
jgi:hypothetical protein